MSDPKLDEAIERALEAFVYAPVGLVFEGPDPFPKLVEKGRNQVNTARLIGEFAVRTGSGKLRREFESQRRQFFENLGNLGVPGLSQDQPAAERPAATTAPANASAHKAAAKKSAAKKAAAKRSPKPDLAIPDYDALSASQVVSRLGGLSTAELEAVRLHEASHRGRKTILNKVAQLQA